MRVSRTEIDTLRAPRTGIDTTDNNKSSFESRQQGSCTYIQTPEMRLLNPIVVPLQTLPKSLFTVVITMIALFSRAH